MTNKWNIKLYIFEI